MSNRILASIDPVILGERLTNARQAQGLTLQQASDAIGVTPSLIADIERGVRLPRGTELVKLAQHYRRSVIEFVGEGNRPILKDSDELTQGSIEAAVLAYLAGDLSQVELARWLGIDIVTMRELVQQVETGSPWDMVRLEQLRSEQQERINALWAFAAGFADLSPEEIEDETTRALTEVRGEQRPGPQ